MCFVSREIDSEGEIGQVEVAREIQIFFSFSQILDYLHIILKRWTHNNNNQY